MNYTKRNEWKVIVSKVTTGEFYSVVNEYRKHQFEIAKVASGAESKANAHLIAAAPELYEALLSALGSLVALDIKNHSWGQGILDGIQQAIAKAEGGS